MARRPLFLTAVVALIVGCLEAPPTALPFDVGNRRGLGRGSTHGLARRFGALGYPGYAYLGSSRSRANPAEVLLRTVAAESVDPRLLEASPWLLLHFRDFERDRRMKVTGKVSDGLIRELHQTTGLSSLSNGNGNGNGNG